MKSYHAPHEAYPWGETHTTRPTRLSRSEGLSDNAQTHQEGIENYRIPHPNVAAEMHDTGHVLNNDLVDNPTAHARNAIRGYQADGTYGTLDTHEVFAVSDKLRRDEEEREKTEVALEIVNARLAKIALGGKPRWGKRRELAEEMVNLEADRAYLNGRRAKLSFNGETGEDDDESWQITAANFANAGRPDGRTNLDVLHQAAIDEEAAKHTNK